MENQNVFDVVNQEVSEQQMNNLKQLGEAMSENKQTSGIPGQMSEEELRQFYEKYRKTHPIVREYSKIGRNDPCPCGSGKKYKNCCLDSGKYEETHEL